MEIGRKINAIWEKIIEPSPLIVDPSRKLYAKIGTSMVIVIFSGVVLNLLFGTGLKPIILLPLILSYIVSRTKYYNLSTFLIIAIILIAVLIALISDGEYDNLTIFTNFVWVSLYLILASLLLSVRQLVITSSLTLAVLLLLVALIPEVNLKSIGVTFGFIWMFSSLLAITIWQRDLLEKARQEQLKFLATHDQLTELPNRLLFHDRLSLALARAKRNDWISAILYLDLDDFKYVNDAFGHERGDHLLRIIAERIQSCTRELDTVARLAGDEFVILIENVGNLTNVAAITEKILSNVIQPIHFKHTEIMISGSIGIVLFQGGDESIDDLLQKADAAMFHAKSDGKNSFAFYEAKMTSEARHRIQLSTHLMKAIDKNELSLEFQPQFDTLTNKITGVEALLRWELPELGQISPREFIPIAESNGMMQPIGEFVLKNAWALNHGLKSLSLPALRISVNLSGRQLKDSQLVSNMEKIITQNNLDPNLLELEITENSLFKNINETIHLLKGLKSLGLRIAIDDFGTGYSSLNYLGNLPIDTIKIDQSFIADISPGRDFFPILDSIISLGRDLGMDVIAEGVETKDQLEYLVDKGCHLIQGFYFYPPLKKPSLISAITNS